MCKSFPIGKRFKIYYIEDQICSCLFKFQFLKCQDEFYIKIVYESDHDSEILIPLNSQK